MLFEHIYGFLAEAKPGENMILSYEQMKGLGAITSNAIRLLGNASAHLSKERRKAVLNKINSKGTLSSLQKSFHRLANTCLVMDLRQELKPDLKQQKLCFKLLQSGIARDLLSFFSRLHHPFQTTREPLGWCQSRVPVPQQLQPVAGLISGPRKECQKKKKEKNKNKITLFNDGKNTLQFKLTS